MFEARRKVGLWSTDRYIFRRWERYRSPKLVRAILHLITFLSHLAKNVYDIRAIQPYGTTRVRSALHEPWQMHPDVFDVRFSKAMRKRIYRQTRVTCHTRHLHNQHVFQRDGD
jgi:hypothetical protein